MSGYYPDGVNQAIFDRYWNELGYADENPLDESEDIDDALYELWADRSDLFAPPMLGVDGGVE